MPDSDISPEQESSRPLRERHPICRCGKDLGDPEVVHAPDCNYPDATPLKGNDDAIS